MSDYIDNEEVTTIREAITTFLLSCKVEVPEDHLCASLYRNDV